MDSLEKQLMLRDAEKYGYQLVSFDSADPVTLLRRMVESNDGRVLEGIPVVLTNMLMQQVEVDFQEIERQLQTALQRRFRMFVCITYLFFFWVPEGESARKHLYEYLKSREPSLIEKVKEQLQARGSLIVGAGVRLDVERLEKTYRNYVVDQFMQTKASLTKRVEESREQALNHALSELFTEKQRAIIMKTMARETLTKTEREYYSRVVRPRLKALRNPDLQVLVAALLG